MPSKGGAHVNDLTPEAKAAIAAFGVPAWVKFLNPVDFAYLRSLRARNPDVRFVFRSVYDGAKPADIAADTEATLRRFDGAHGGADEIVIEVPRNEMDTGVGDPDSLRRYVDATIPTLDRYAAHGFKVAVGCFGVGWPRLEDVPILVPLLLAAAERGGYLATHEYWLPTDGLMPGQTNWSWWGMRYRRVWNLIREVAPIPILITECGVDGGLERKDAHGWRAYNLTPGVYAAQVRAYLQQLAEDPFVHGMMLYDLDALDHQWDSFRYADAPEVLAALTAPMGGRSLWLPSPDAATPPAASLAGAEANPPPIHSTGGSTVATPGIDVSNNNGLVDLNAVVSAGYRFVLAKASGDEGPSHRFIDPVFPDTWRRTGGLGMARVAYHYACPSAVSPAESVATLQAALVAAGGLEPGDNVALDVEDPRVPDGTSLHVWVAEWLDLAQRVFGVAPWKYSARYYTSTHDLEHDDLSRYPTWWAAYQANKPAPVTGWGPIRLWQHAADGTVPGVQGACDLNLFDGTVADLRALGLPGTPTPHPAPAPTPTPPPTPAPAPTFDVDATRSALWGIKDDLATNGWPRFAQAIEAAVTQSKGEQ